MTTYDDINKRRATKDNGNRRASPPWSRRADDIVRAAIWTPEADTVLVRGREQKVGWKVLLKQIQHMGVRVNSLTALRERWYKATGRRRGKRMAGMYGLAVKYATRRCISCGRNFESVDVRKNQFCNRCKRAEQYREAAADLAVAEYCHPEDTVLPVVEMSRADYDELILRQKGQPVSRRLKWRVEAIR
ncbi:MAG: hypothetical protein OEW11_11400 [Nitrospirota bacterium]|nr:hypothetical protein [Nitrospirota bacterium]